MQMPNKHNTRCLTSMLTRDMQVNPTMRHHFTPTSMTVINKTGVITSIGEDAERMKYIDLECKMVQPLWKTVWKFLKRLNQQFLS